MSTRTLFIFMLIACGCEKKHDIDNCTNYLADEKNGLYQHYSNDGFSLSCAYIPSEVVFAQQVPMNNSATNDNSFDQNERAKNVYVSLRFSINGQEAEHAFIRNEQLYTSCLNYLNGYVYQDVSLCTPTDSIPAIASTYARQYGATHTSPVLVVFSKGTTDLSHGFEVLYRGDKFGVGTIHFPFTADAINKIPDFHN